MIPPKTTNLPKNVPSRSDGIRSPIQLARALAARWLKTLISVNTAISAEIRPSTGSVSQRHRQGDDQPPAQHAGHRADRGHLLPAGPTLDQNRRDELDENRIHRHGRKQPYLLVRGSQLEEVSGHQAHAGRRRRKTPPAWPGHRISLSPY